MGILRIRDPVLYPYRRLHSVACVFFRWHEKCEPAQLCKILFLPSDPSCDFRNRGCHHWRCSSQRCCILLRFPLLIGKISLEILIPCFIEKARHPYLALLRLMVTGSSTFSISPGSAMYSLSSAHFDAASSIARSTLHAFASIKSLHKKSAVSSAEFGL